LTSMLRRRPMYFDRIDRLGGVVRDQGQLLPARDRRVVLPLPVGGRVGEARDRRREPLRARRRGPIRSSRSTRSSRSRSTGSQRRRQAATRRSSSHGSPR
jgi:hypothetical protein